MSVRGQSVMRRTKKAQGLQPLGLKHEYKSHSRFESDYLSFGFKNTNVNPATNPPARSATM